MNNRPEWDTPPAIVADLLKGEVRPVEWLHGTRAGRGFTITFAGVLIGQIRLWDGDTEVEVYGYIFEQDPKLAEVIKAHYGAVRCCDARH